MAQDFQPTEKKSLEKIYKWQESIEKATNTGTCSFHKFHVWHAFKSPVACDKPKTPMPTTKRKLTKAIKVKWEPERFPVRKKGLNRVLSRVCYEIRGYKK